MHPYCSAFTLSVLYGVMLQISGIHTWSRLTDFAILAAAEWSLPFKVITVVTCGGDGTLP